MAYEKALNTAAFERHYADHGAGRKVLSPDDYRELAAADILSPTETS